MKDLVGAGVLSLHPSSPTPLLTEHEEDGRAYLIWTKAIGPLPKAARFSHPRRWSGLEGRQPPELTAQSLQAGRFDIPVDWEAQKRALGFAPSL
jgi:hypothetical protein